MKSKRQKIPILRHFIVTRSNFSFNSKKKYKYKGEKVNVSKNQKNNVPFRTKNLTTGNEKIQQQNVS